MLKLEYELYDSSDFADEAYKYRKEENPDASEDAIWAMVNDEIDAEADNLRAEFGDIEGDFIICGSMGRWDGRHGGFSPYFDTNLGEMLVKLMSGFSDSGSNTHVWIDRNGDVRAYECHHDGSNSYLLRKVKKGVTREYIENLGENLNVGKRLEDAIMKFTAKAGLPIAKAYGWK